METEINTAKKTEIEKGIILISLSIFLISLVYALTPPPLPDHFIGNVIIDGQNAPIGTEIKVYVNSALESVYSVSEAGKYDLFVTTGSIGNTIEFKISDQLAGSSTRKGGETINLDLSLTTTTTTPPSSGSSGGSGGGGGSSGGSGGIISPPPTTIKESLSDTLENETQEQESENLEETSPEITGAVIGFLGSGKGISTIVIIVILVIGVILIKFKPQKWKRN